MAELAMRSQQKFVADHQHHPVLQINTLRCKSLWRKLSFRWTKKYIVSVSERANGPWTQINSGNFHPNPRISPRDIYRKRYMNTLGRHDVRWNLKTFKLENSVWARYVKFECLTFSKKGCALEYIGVFSGRTIEDFKYIGCCAIAADRLDNL